MDFVPLVSLNILSKVFAVEIPGGLFWEGERSVASFSQKIHNASSDAVFSLEVA